MNEDKEMRTRGAFSDYLADYRLDAVVDDDRLREDAARYQYIRNIRDSDVRIGGVYAHERVYDGYHFLVTGERLDAVIDAARQAEILKEGD